MVYLVIGLWLITVCVAVLYENYVSKEVWDLQSKVKKWDGLWKEHTVLVDNIGDLNRNTTLVVAKTKLELKELADNFSKLSVEQLQRFERFQKDLEFMRAHQHGMDKRIASLKREVIVTINNAPEKGTAKPKVTKQLLKRAGVTQ